MAKKTRRGQKQCPSCKTWIKGTRAKTCPKCNHEFRPKQEAVAAPKAARAVMAAPEAPAKPANTVTIEQIKAVSQMVKTTGGFGRLHELLGLIKEVGGLKKFKDLLEAMEVPEPGRIPF
jgi:hypothetical protein